MILDEDDDDIEREAIQAEGEEYEEIICAFCKPDLLRPKSNIFDCRKAYNEHIKKVHIEKKPKKAEKAEKCNDAMRRIQKHVDAAVKRNSAEDLTEKLSGSLLLSGGKPKSSKKEKEEMAAKKKTAAKKTGGAPKKAAAAGVGRERKMLLRLSVAEYKALQKQSDEKGMSMAMLLRSVIKM